uniref:BED-type domain-containing protein n=1 Tax=Romanomermis culicivorax TaxID=13658 RepID=A0A915L5N5_ROMCU
MIYHATLEGGKAYSILTHQCDRDIRHPSCPNSSLSPEQQICLSLQYLAPNMPINNKCEDVEGINIKTKAVHPSSNSSYSRQEAMNLQINPTTNKIGTSPYNTYSCIWEYFEWQNDDCAICKACRENNASKGSTGALNKHLIVIHPKFHGEMKIKMGADKRDEDPKKTKWEQATDEAQSQLLIQSCFPSKADDDTEDKVKLGMEAVFITSISALRAAYEAYDEQNKIKFDRKKEEVVIGIVDMHQILQTSLGAQQYRFCHKGLKHQKIDFSRLWEKRGNDSFILFKGKELDSQWCSTFTNPLISCSPGAE